MINVLGLALYGPLAASTRYRLLQYRPGLADKGINLEVQSLLGDEYLLRRFNGGRLPLISMLRSGLSRIGRLVTQRRYDCAIIHCELFKLLPGAIESRLLRVPYIYDFDDAFYLKYQSSRLAAIQSMLGGKFDSVIRCASAVTAGSRILANYAGKLNRETTLLPTVVDTSRYRREPRTSGDVFTVAWIGSPSTFEYLMQIVDPLASLGREGPVRLVLVGGRTLSLPNVDVVEVPWSEDSEISYINSFDVGVMPLPDDDWARGKCAFKLIQYMACGVPVIASPVGANQDVLCESSGFLADSRDEWLRALRFLRDNPKVRSTMGRSARVRIEDEYSLHRNLPLLANVIESVCRVTGVTGKHVNRVNGR